MSGAVFLSPAYDRSEYLGAESLGIRAIAAALYNRGVEVEVFDEVAEIDSALISALQSASLIGIGTLFTRQIPAALLLVKQARAIAPNAHITMGGQGVAFLWEQVLNDCPDLDSCCMYEGDDIVCEIWDRMLQKLPLIGISGLYVRQVGGQVEAPPRARNPVEDLDSLPFVYRGTRVENYRDGHATMYTSRGCAAHCSFCQSGNYGNRYHKLTKWRHRSASHIVTEIEFLLTLGITAISIVDDDFLGGDGRGRARAEEFAQLIDDRGICITFSIECRVDEIDQSILSTLRRAGLRHVLIGIESANQFDDNLFAKKVSTEEIETAITLLRRLDIDFSAGFIMFHPLSTVDRLQENLSFMAKHKIGTYRRVTNRLELYPGAPLLSYFRRRGVDFREDSYRLYYDFVDPVVARYYSVARTILHPFIELESAAETARFAADNASTSTSRREIYLLTMEISGALVDAADKCLAHIMGGNADAELERLSPLIIDTVRGLSARVANVKSREAGEADLNRKEVER
ncbi:B12-binding domain-containing radical SAM protein [Amycolatopsis sp. CB00013]|uniref:B12-binding domain-containing radical SAM protein n=1 Tax=Amycolatopsis sp. CB00013 TaxID=1703945 RepID=UPI000A74D70A|nr:radical SAM protein [Amycolatopsis sp. CB00013]